MKNNIRYYSSNSTFIIVIIILMGTILVDTVSICLAQNGPWTFKDSTIASRWFLSASVVNGKIYAMGGMRNPRKVEEYDPMTDSWTTKESMSTSRAGFGTSVVNGKIYAFGGNIPVDAGLSGTDVTEEYDPSTNTWTSKRNMPEETYGVCACTVNDKIYVIGGDPPMNRNDMYDPVTDEWVTKSPMPTPRWLPTCVVVDGKIYVFGGYTNIGGNTSGAVEMYDPVTDSWSKKARMPLNRAAHATAFVGGKIHVLGGLSIEFGIPYDNHWIYDPATDTWNATLPSMPFSWSHMGYAVVNDIIYLMAGSEVKYPHDDYLQRVVEYNPHNDFSLIVENVNCDKAYAIPGDDNILITTKINNPTGITIIAEIEAPGQTHVDSVELFDDGNHNDGLAGDSLYANTWQTPANVECNYYIDLQITRVEADTVFQELDNMARFTTIGPIIYDSRKPNETASPGALIDFNLILKNQGLVGNALSIEAELYTDNPEITIHTHKSKFYNIPAGTTKESEGKYYVDFSPDINLDSPIYLKIIITSDGYHFWSDSMQITDHVIAVDEQSKNLPSSYSLQQNYPNPFNPVTMINYQLSMSSDVELSIYNLLGQRVAVLVSEKQTAGRHLVEWNASRFPSGIYYYQLVAGDYWEVRKMALVR